MSAINQQWEWSHYIRYGGASQLVRKAWLGSVILYELEGAIYGRERVFIGTHFADVTLKNDRRRCLWKQ